MSGLQTSWAFSLLGPIANGGDAWQVDPLGYNYPGSADIGEPKNLGEEYRWNTPVLYYAEDANVLDFYGSNGVVAINQAFTILNTSLTNVDANSTALTEFPLNSTAMNYQASALGLRDMKSVVMQAMVEELGLADPIRFVWTLHNRYLPPGAKCPGYEYLVVQRNYDITASPLNQVQYSPYVNGTLYTYYLFEGCLETPAPDPVSQAEPVIVDPLNFNPPVSSVYEAPISDGGYYLGLTRDDMGGFRYLLSTNNILYESPTPGAVLLSSAVSGGVSYGQPFALYTSNYTAFAEAALTNDPVTLSNLYPGLIITSSTPFFSYTPVTTYVAYYTNLIGAPAGSQTLVVAPVTTYTVVTTYSNTYANLVVPPGSSTNGSSVGTVYTVTVAPAQGAPIGSPLQTNTAISFVSQPNVPVGDFYINTNACGTNLILSTLASIPVYSTNVIYAATNAAGESATQYIVTTSTTHIYVAAAPICGNSSGGGTTATNAPGLYQGIGHMQFVQASYDSLLGQYFQPITNNYTMHLISNSKVVNETFQRVVTAPDILFTAADLAPGPAELLYGNFYARSAPNYDENNVGAGLAGPGTLDPTIAITFNKVSNRYLNTAGGDELTQSQYPFYGSYDGTTNDPVVYPNGTSIANLANQVLVQITPAALPDGTNGVAYPPTGFSISGGAFTAPYTWTAPNAGLPPGLTLSSTGVISGTPTLAGTFDFTVQLTDVNARTVQWTYSLTIQ